MKAQQIAGVRPGRQGSKALGALLRKYRKEKGLTMYKLAEIIDRDRSTISLWESGNAPLTNDDTISRISEVLDIPKDEIYAASDYVPLDIWVSLCDMSADELGQTRQFVTGLLDGREQESHSEAT